MTSITLSPTIACLNENCRQRGIPRVAQSCPECGFYFPSRPVLPGGTTLLGGRYVVDYAIGCGGYGVTYRGFHTDFEDVVAIKEFFPQGMVGRDPRSGALITASKTREEFRDRLERFKKEGRTLRRIKHAGVVRAQDLFEERGTAYLVMDFIEGRTLRDELETSGGKLDAGRIEGVVGMLVEALEAIHARDVHHLDLKPENVLITLEGRAVLVDFGSARAGGRLRTKTIVAMTEQYAAPELAAHQAVSPKSDLYSLGVMVCEMLTGRCPPMPVERLMGASWDSSELGDQWKVLLEPILELAPDKRPASARAWWRGKEKKSVAAPVVRRVRFPKGFVKLPAGRFMMGTSGDEGRFGDEAPQHEVEITRPFLMMKVPVTQGQWIELMGNNPSRFKGISKRSERPVESVSWFDAVAYCNALSKREGLEESYELRGVSGRPGTRGFKCEDVVFRGLDLDGYRLPTEAEWEYACRAGTTAPRYGELDEIAWYERNSKSQTHSVGKKKANLWGLHDTLGNVWEWCWDRYDSGYYGVSPTQDPTGPSNGEFRVRRGGSFGLYAVYVRAANRVSRAPDFANDGLGFRCARLFQ